MINKMGDLLRLRLFFLLFFDLTNIGSRCGGRGTSLRGLHSMQAVQVANENFEMFQTIISLIHLMPKVSVKYCNIYIKKTPNIMYQ